MDKVFKALADSSRRDLLDGLFAGNGQTLAELCSRLEMSRQAVSKHLAILEAANLVATVRQGREKLHLLNPVPIHEIAVRWMGKYEHARLGALADLKSALEKGEKNAVSDPTTDISRFKPKTVYVTYIAATPEKVWQALTDPAFTKQYFGGFEVDVEPRDGGAFRLLFSDGRVHVRGHVVDWSPPKRFSCTWVMEAPDDFRGLPESLVTYDIEPAGDAVRLTMTEAHSWAVPDAILAGGEQGWPPILSGLKSLLETGKAPAIEQTMPDGFVDAVRAAVAEKPWAGG